uniref:Uncharacterized protein n=1 Tax=Plectus sambesii TaxID=2011161 RepID=A0A914WYT2_9BILA
MLTCNERRLVLFIDRRRQSRRLFLRRLSRRPPSSSSSSSSLPFAHEPSPPPITKWYFVDRSKRSPAIASDTDSAARDCAHERTLAQARKIALIKRVLTVVVGAHLGSRSVRVEGSGRQRTGGMGRPTDPTETELTPERRPSHSSSPSSSSGSSTAMGPPQAPLVPTGCWAARARSQAVSLVIAVLIVDGHGAT